MEATFPVPKNAMLMKMNFFVLFYFIFLCFVFFFFFLPLLFGKRKSTKKRADRVSLAVNFLKDPSFSGSLLTEYKRLSRVSQKSKRAEKEM